MAKSKKINIGEKDLVERLQALGYKVKKDEELVRHTFVVPKALLEQFVTEARSRKLKIQDAVKAAFEDWLKKEDKKA